MSTTSRITFLAALLALLISAQPAHGQSAHVRVSQVGYETGAGPFRAYLMAPAPVTGETFKVVNSKGKATDDQQTGLGQLPDQPLRHLPSIVRGCPGTDYGDDPFCIQVRGALVEQQRWHLRDIY